MEKLTREIRELSQTNAELVSLGEFLTSQTYLMNKKAAQIFILDLRDYVEALEIVTNLVPAADSQQQEPRKINSLLTREYELIKLIQRDFQRLLKAQGEKLNLFDLNAEQITHIMEQLEQLHILNQFLLQDNLVFQTMISTHETTGGNIRVGKKKSFWQRLLNRK
ncbi:hypothetical protein [Enterococcus pallens]|uniref:Uncharacterized protein n=1 Tax=Enterococcus pallens ATCC BAA-351 TaxID=1158607 RepID=R2QQ69_9ENTE|nr:hypothetical protein [Enterococcus pallens]EOH97363.1 hypothetical protein UAU_00031 [Enterococcus pallens ATCC BAA-351]EOU21218.1 hypothetical protein I588_02065 [Enterococcus pallens ATCC BAA-351]OJG80577.1 hypothetical protein RV10_GL004314 [Enterococcus pallens]